MTDRILRLPEVVDKVGLSRSSIYDRMSKGAFPDSVSLGSRAIGWRERDIDQWLQALPSSRARADADDGGEAGG